MPYLVCEGNTYQGRFKVEQRVHRWTEEVTSEVGRHPEQMERKWYEGEGVIRDKVTGMTQRFIFMPVGLGEEDIIRTSKHLSRTNSALYKLVVDEALNLMFMQAQTSQEILPRVGPPVLPNELIDKLIK